MSILFSMIYSAFFSTNHFFQFSNFTFLFAQIAVKPIFHIQFYFLYFLNNFLIDYHLLVNYLILSSFTFLFPLFCSSISLQAFRLFPQAAEFWGSLHRDEESGGQEVNEDRAPSPRTCLLAPVINNQPWQNSCLAKDVYNKNEKAWRLTTSKSTCSSSTHACHLFVISPKMLSPTQEGLLQPTAMALLCSGTWNAIHAWLAQRYTLFNLIFQILPF